jgi:hypothetical protein
VGTQGAGGDGTTRRGAGGSGGTLRGCVPRPGAPDSPAAGGHAHTGSSRVLLVCKHTERTNSPPCSSASFVSANNLPAALTIHAVHMQAQQAALEQRQKDVQAAKDGADARMQRADAARAEAADLKRQVPCR